MTGSTEPRWLSRLVTDALHQELVREHGGNYGIRDEGLIESALSRPRNRWSYDPNADLATLAAAYGYGLARNHGYIDGNKRIAFMALYVFLGLNGHDLEVDEHEVVEVMVSVASGKLSEQNLATWVRTHTINAP